MNSWKMNEKLTLPVARAMSLPSQSLSILVVVLSIIVGATRPVLADSDPLEAIVTPWTHLNAAEDANPINDPGRIRSGAFDTFSGSPLQASFRSGLGVGSVGANAGALSVSSDRSMTTTFRVNENGKLHLLNYLKAALIRTNVGQSKVEAKIVVRDMTDATDILTVDAANFAGKWTHTKNTNGTLNVNDSSFPVRDVIKNHTYSITARLKGDVGPIPKTTAGNNVLDIGDITKDYQFGVAYAVKPTAALKDWRGADGVNATKARELKVDKAGTEKTLSGDGVKIGMFESFTPILNHDDLKGISVLKDGTRFNANADKEAFRGEHATAVAGIMGGQNGAADKSGVAPGARIVSASSAAGKAATSHADIANAFGDFRTEGARIVNFSWGNTNPVKQALINKEINKQVDFNDMVVVAAAGNDRFLERAPGSASNAIAVGAMDTSFRKVVGFSAEISGAGLPPHLVAPGEYIDTAVVVPMKADKSELDAAAPNDYDNIFYGHFRSGRGNQTTGAISGTSFSAPMTSGTVALMHELLSDPKFDPAQAARYKKADMTRAVLMTAAEKKLGGKDLLLKDGKTYAPHKAAKLANPVRPKQDLTVYDQIGAGFLNARKALDLINSKTPLVKKPPAAPPAIPVKAPSESKTAALASSFASAVSDPPGPESLERFDATGEIFYDVFDVQPLQEFEIAMPSYVDIDTEISLTSSWLESVGTGAGGGDQNLNMALALFRDLDGTSDSDGIGSDQPFTYLTDGSGQLIDILFESSQDELVMIADGGWKTTEHLYVTAEEPGFYYFRMVNLSNFGDEMAFAGTAVVPEPLILSLLTLGALSIVRRRRKF